MATSMEVSWDCELQDLCHDENQMIKNQPAISAG